MKLFGKKTLALALALTMVLSLCPLTAMAEGTTPGESTGSTEPKLTVSGVSVDPMTMTLEAEKRGTVTATVTMSDGSTNSNVKWESSNDGVATVENGTVTAVAAGTAKIVAAATADQTKYAECTVTVTAKQIHATDIQIKTSKPVMVIGETSKFVATVTPENTTDTVTWESSAPAVARVDAATGNVTAVSVGTATITASVGTGLNTKTIDASVTVVDGKVYGLSDPKTATKTMNYGTTEAQVKAELAKLEWNVTFGDATNNVAGTAKIPASGWSCTNFQEKKAGQFTFTGSFGTGLDVTVNVAISQGKITGYTAPSINVAKGTSYDAVLALLSKETYKFDLESGGPKTFTVAASGTASDYTWTATSNPAYSVTAAEGTEYIFTANLNSGKLADIDTNNNKSINAKVKIVAEKKLGETKASLAYSSNNTYINLYSDSEYGVKTVIEKAIKDRGLTNGIKTGSVKIAADGNLKYGTLNTSTFIYTVTSSKLINGTMVERFTYEAQDMTGFKYTGTIELTIYTFDVFAETSTSDPIVYFKDGIASKIADAFKARYGSTPTYIEFGSIGRNDDELGELRDGNGDSVEDGTYTFASKDEDYDSVANIYFVPTGVGGTFDIEYTAYSGSSKRSSSMTGTISIKCDEMLVVWLNDMGAGETQNLSASAIQEQVTEILDTNKISYTLDTVSLNRPSTGTIYDGNNKKITTKTVDAEDLDDYTYEAPAKVTSANLVSIRFSVKCKSDSGKSSKKTENASGVMLFNLTKKADITITAPANDAAVLGTDVFQTYFEKNASSTYRKNYDACYVVFSGAPNSNTSGYLYDGYKSGIINGSKIKSPNGKKFALTDISAYDKNAYDLSNTYYVPGSRNCTGGTFEIYGVKSGTTIKSSTRFTKLCEGSIDYVVGSAAAAITGTINASNYMQMTPSAFTKTNKNASYVVFTAQPAGGKLVYNYNRTTPGVVKEISLNTPYYITYSAANANYYLGYVSFVPAYTAVKGVTSVIDIPCTIYSSSKTGTAASVKISVVSATKSAKFTDVGVAYMPYADSIDFLYNCGITTGTSTTGSLYNPSGSVTRGEWITMLYRAAGSPKMSNKIPFTDVTAKNSYSWCYDAVRWAYQNNICQGTGATTFSPAMKLDRQQIVTFMYNYAVKYNGGNGAGSSINGYTDSASVASWAKAPMEWAVKNQYYTVVGTRLQPTDSANRAEVALYMHRLLTY